VIKRNTVLLALAQAFVGLGTQLVPTLTAIMVQQLLGSPALAGLGTSILGVSRLLIAYPIGDLSDRFGRRVSLVLGQGLCLIGAPLMSLAMVGSSFALFVVAALIFGLGVGAGQQLRLAAADMFLPKRRAEGLGYVLTGSLVGALGAPLLMMAAQGLAEQSGQDSLAVVWLLVPLVLVPSVILVVLVRPDPKTIAQHLERFYPGYVPELGMRGAVGESGLRAWMGLFPLTTAFVSSFAAQGVMAMMMAMTSLALAHHDYALPLISLSVSIHVIGMFGPSVPLGRLADRAGRRTVMLLGIALSAFGSVLVPTSSQYGVITAGTFLVGVGWAGVSIAASALIADVIGPHERGRTIGVNDAFSQASSIVMPLIAGPMVALAGLPSLSILALVVLAIPVVFLVRLHEPSPGRFGHMTGR
jgi:MFS family permease